MLGKEHRQLWSVLHSGSVRHSGGGVCKRADARQSWRKTWQPLVAVWAKTNTPNSGFPEWITAGKQRIPLPCMSIAHLPAVSIKFIKCLGTGILHILVSVCVCVVLNRKVFSFTIIHHISNSIKLDIILANSFFIC